MKIQKKKFSLGFSKIQFLGVSEIQNVAQHCMDSAAWKTCMLVLWKDKFAVWLSSKLYSR